MAKAYLQDVVEQGDDYKAAKAVTALNRMIHARAQQILDLTTGEVFSDFIIFRVSHDMANWRVGLVAAKTVRGIGKMSAFLADDPAYDVVAGITTTIGHCNAIIAEAQNIIPSALYDGKDTVRFWYANADGTVAQHKLTAIQTASLRPLATALLADGQ